MKVIKATEEQTEAQVEKGAILVGTGKYPSMPKGVEFENIPTDMATHLVTKGAATIKK